MAFRRAPAVLGVAMRCGVPPEQSPRITAQQQVADSHDCSLMGRRRRLWTPVSGVRTIWTWLIYRKSLKH